MSEVLRAEHTVSFSYRRSVGGAERAFLEGLAHCRILGSRSADGRIVVPPVDWDPVSGADTHGFVEVSSRGVVRSWTWEADPSPDHPVDRPFAWALIQLDGTDTSLLHLVDVPDLSLVHGGMRVRAEWRAERTGSIRDLRAFVPDPGPGPGRATGHEPGGDDAPETGPGQLSPGAGAPVEVTSDLCLRYTFEPGLTSSRFLRALGARRIEGGRCPQCASVYVPPRPRCPLCRRGPLDPVVLGDRGTIVSHCVVHVPVHGSEVPVPFVWAWIRLDGADVPFAHLIGSVAPEQARVGQRVEAVWVPDRSLAATWESIQYFRPLDHPAVPGEPPC